MQRLLVARGCHDVLQLNVLRPSYLDVRHALLDALEDSDLHYEAVESYRIDKKGQADDVRWRRIHFRYVSLRRCD